MLVDWTVFRGDWSTPEEERVVVMEEREVLTCGFEALPAGTPLTEVVDVIDDPSRRAEVVRSVSIDRFSIGPAWGAGEAERIDVRVQFDSPAVPLGFEVVLRDPADHTRTQPIMDWFVAAVEPGGSSGHGFHGGGENELGLEVFDVLVVPSLRAAYEDEHGTATWMGEPIVFEGVVPGEPTYESPVRAVGYEEAEEAGGRMER